MGLHRRKQPAPPAPPPAQTPLLFQKVSHPQKRALLEAYAACATITGAAAATDVTPRSHYYWLRDDPDYAAAFQIAHQMAIAAHEDEASRRALGWDETHYAHDGTPYTVRKYSDTMLIFRLKALRPEIYRETPPRGDRSEVSELLKAVLLELAERQSTRDVTPEAEWAPLPPTDRAVPRASPALPAPPAVEEDA